MKYKFNPANFMGVGHEVCRLEKCGFFFVPIPYEKTTTYIKGTAKGPAAIINASCQVEVLDEELMRETWQSGICTLPPVNCKGSALQVFKRIERAAEKTFKFNAVPFFVGGEHTISQPLILSAAKKYKNMSVLHFDAHADLRAEYEGSPHNHACAMYPASKACKVVQVGIRSVGETEIQNTNCGNVKTFFMHENRDIKKLAAKVLRELTGAVYLSIDVDGFDPSVIPATGTPQPGGFCWYDALYLFKEVCKHKKIIAADVVEVSPVKNSAISETAAAKLIYRLMGYISRVRRKKTS
ncbi:MAG: agmatinase [Elusimicrobia bacterium]|nr:agmatinase [Elusimicrobiota bacterium]